MDQASYQDLSPEKAKENIMRQLWEYQKSEDTYRTYVVEIEGSDIVRADGPLYYDYEMDEALRGLFDPDESVRQWIADNEADFVEKLELNPCSF